MRMNKLRYRRMDADQNEAIINSHHPAVGLPYHVIRLASFLCTSTCSTIASLLDDVQSAKPYKFTPDSKRHGGAIHDSEAAPFHFGIVRRRGNGTRYTKDAIQSTVGNINDPSDKERVAREAAWRLMLFLQQSVFSKLKKWVGHHGNVEGQGEIARWAKFEEAMRYGVCKAREQNSLPDDKEVIHYHYLVSSVAIGYAEAVVPHLDINDGNSYSFIFQVDGPTGYTRVPQLGVDIAHRTGRNWYILHLRSRNLLLGFGRTTMGPNETRFLWGGARRPGENRPDPLQALAMGHDAPPMGPDERSSSR
ncbi:hypothetical protein J000_06202 [Cryptococcus neoformans]|nr:hypothetical protein J000_06202 [Cryptococcus neoformans var. grubii]